MCTNEVRMCRCVYKGCAGSIHLHVSKIFSILNLQIWIRNKNDQHTVKNIASLVCNGNAL